MIRLNQCNEYNTDDIGKANSMSDKFYGWIGKLKNYTLNGGRGAGTDTSKYIKYYAEQIGATIADDLKDVRTKNLLMYEGKYYYVLSIGKGRPAWAPYPFIDNLENVYFILTRDGNEEGEGTLWHFKYDKENMKLTRNERKNGGDYYALPLNKVKEECEGIPFSLYDGEEMKKILRKVLG